MPYDGNGNFVRLHNWTSDAANGIDINASEMDGEDNGFAAGLSLAVTRDGQGKPTADFLPNADNTLNLGSGVKRWMTLNGIPLANWNGVYVQPNAAEIAAAVTPTNYGYQPYDIRRYGAVGDGATDCTAALNNALAAAVSGGAAVFVPDGIFVHGRLNAFLGPVKIKGNGGDVSILRVSSAAWPYTGNTNPVYSTAYSFSAEGVGFDQNWITGTYGGPSGTYNDAASPTTWGGNFLGLFFGGGFFDVHHCKFYNIARGFLVSAAQPVNFSDNTSSSLNSPGQTICATTLCGVVTKNNNRLIANRWNAGSLLYGLSALYGFGDSDVTMNNNVLVGHQVVYNGNTGAAARMVCCGNVIDTPVADTSFQGWNYLTVTGNQITSSGDMGIATDNSSYVNVSNNVINGTFSGGINVGGATDATVVGNIIKDIAQGYTQINTIGSRYASSAGAWLAGVTVNFQNPDTGGQNICITGNVVSWANLPPVNDTYGPIRAVTKGIYIQQTSSGSWINGSVTGNYVPANYASLPYAFVAIPTHRAISSAKTGTPIPGELFTNGANSFIYHSDYGAGNSFQFKKLIGTIPASTVFTGGLSGATITSAAAPGLTWHSLVDTGNFDWTATYNPY